MLRTKKILASVCATAIMAVGVGAPVADAANQQQNGLVNVAVGNIAILNDAHIGIAAQVAASVCGVNVGPVAVLAANVNATGVQRTVCTTTNGPVTLTQA